MKTIFITGTSSGLGKAMVQLFHSKGWSVIATMRNPDKIKDFDLLERVTVLPLDITNPAQVNSTVAAAIALGDIDVVINNAAYGAIGPLESVSDEQLLNQIDTNLLGAIRVTKAFISHFREKRSGLFINITSIAGLVTFPFDSLYHAAKWGMEGWTEGMSYELATFGIGIKAIAPGYIRSEFASNILMTHHEAYEPLMDKYLEVVFSMMDPDTSGSSVEQIAELAYEASTDGKDQVHYTAGPDSVSMHERRLEIGAEASIKEMAHLFLAQ
ncbi:NAD(P)-dependent dehydrogenase (short-subunit alcohol dehydrogenase family) [Pedobacter cryoconitis]|uniref:NAD(P)-dependent dehydrogenase (Short-subunit alcohol dehydrogenase family) n=1 Tax=Pedobacter cryoconitis TaxID=188932 RepID=A0A7W9E2J6_9SPHI|nr:SDR family oxidoreductase [Pedobacter cryoconitis]MBB5638845.1 NAD(P)-dependent dehydrogenase (short-subunit alcohol dehydrogenase family) [Pedobacter cryoconitis]